MPKMKDILTEEEQLEISRLRIRMLRAGSIVEGKKIKNKILSIIRSAEKRYYDELGKEKKISV
ncbi:hypothetical protein [Caldifermentibacillus hisashii]|uniref:hypothetical protein n=1 Tax=Caldifermentibacillus hisashii TaxID=996558 RepID=UPI0022B943F9|nr:hypothetical protein [Caldifermentibacillus hisashii]